MIGEHVDDGGAIALRDRFAKSEIPGQHAQAFRQLPRARGQHLVEHSAPQVQLVDQIAMLRAQPGKMNRRQRDGLQEDEDPDEKVDQLRLEATAAHARIS